MNSHQALQKYFGYDAFRPQQEEIISYIVAWSDALVIMPTWWWKSLCYQLPAVLLPWITIVISPLIALMKDQVDALNANGISACYLNSSLDEQTRYALWERIKAWKITIIYLAPESLHVLEPLKAVCTISLVAIDEAHCISSWGHDFRPAYKELKIIKQRLPHVPLIALTATADQATRDDILKQLWVPDTRTFLSSFDRPNLSLEVRPAQKRIEQIVDIIRKQQGNSIIIYCLWRKTTEQIAAKLMKKNIKAQAYHAWLPHDQRDIIQEWFLMDRIQVVCATVAFGMGIDKSNVRTVIHYNLPKSIENFYQEIGRAGRDGLESETILFYSYRDVAMLTQFANQSGNAQVQLAKLERMKQYAESLTCRRKILMNYFGEITIQSCGNCDICNHPPVFIDGTRIVQMALSAMARVGQIEPMSTIIAIVRGSQSLSIISKWYQSLPTYGIGKEYSTSDWNWYLIQMINLWVCQIDFANHEVLRITEFWASILRGEHRLQLAKPNQSHRSLRSKQWQPPVSAYVDTVTDRARRNELFEYLKNWRLETSQRLQVPAYVIFSDKTLKALSKIQPSSLRELESIEWIWTKKLEDYGSVLLNQIKQFSIQKSNKIYPKKSKRSTTQETRELYQQWLTHHEIALQRWIWKSTIISHLIILYQEGKMIDFSSIVDDFTIQKVQDIYVKLGNPEWLKVIYDALDAEVTYDQIKVSLVVKK